jgi:hypothetical protein
MVDEARRHLAGVKACFGTEAPPAEKSVVGLSMSGIVGWMAAGVGTTSPDTASGLKVFCWKRWFDGVYSVGMRKPSFCRKPHAPWKFYRTCHPAPTSP